MGTSGVASTARAVKNEFSEKNVTFLAGSIAYNAFVSLVPLLAVVIIAISLFGGVDANQFVIDQAEQYLGQTMAGILETLLGQTGGGAGAAGAASIIGLVTLVWGSLKIFRGLDTAFSEIYESTAENSLVDQVKDGTVVLLTLVVAVAAMVVSTTVFGVLRDTIPFVGLVIPFVLVAGLVAAFFPMYYLFPDVDVEPREVLPGAVVGAVGWALLQGLFQLYIGATGKTGGQDLLGAIILLLTWLYFSGVVLLLGAVVNAVRGEHTTGSAGGIASGPDGQEAEREETMDRDQAAEYLKRLRQDLTGRYDSERPMTAGGTTGRDGPGDAGTIDVVEHSESGEDGERWEVTLRWTEDR